MKEILPAFLMYAGAFLSDENVVAMDNRAVGVYAKLICFAWMEGGVPDDSDMIRRMVKESETQWPDIWVQIKRCFGDDKAMLKRGIEKTQVQPGRLYLFRLELERARQVELRERYARAGKKGGSRPKKRASQAKAMLKPCLSDVKASLLEVEVESLDPPLPPKGDEKRMRKKSELIPAEGFDAFWAIWPKRDAKVAAVKAWNKISPDAELREKILAAVRLQMKADGPLARERQFIPLPASWLNGRRWEDEPPKGGAKSSWERGVFR